MKFELKKSFHHSKVVDYDLCLQKPYILTGGLDNSLKLWNYVSGHLELDKQFEENLNSISICPNGFYVVVSFYNKVNIFSIIVDDLKCLKTLNLSKITKKSLINTINQQFNNFFPNNLNKHNVHIADFQMKDT